MMNWGVAWLWSDTPALVEVTVVRTWLMLILPLDTMTNMPLVLPLSSGARLFEPSPAWVDGRIHPQARPPQLELLSSASTLPLNLPLASLAQTSAIRWLLPISLVVPLYPRVGLGVTRNSMLSPTFATPVSGEMMGMPRLLVNWTIGHSFLLQIGLTTRLAPWKVLSLATLWTPLVLWVAPHR